MFKIQPVRDVDTILTYRERGWRVRYESARAAAAAWPRVEAAMAARHGHVPAWSVVCCHAGAQSSVHLVAIRSPL